MIAGLSVDYVVRLEQGRARNPSVQVLQALARALQLSTEERDYLFRLAGQLAPDSGRMSSHVTPGIQRLLQRLDELPVSVHDAGWNLIAWNSMWAALMGDPTSFPADEDGYARFLAERGVQQLPNPPIDLPEFVEDARN